MNFDGTRLFVNGHQYHLCHLEVLICFYFILLILSKTRIWHLAVVTRLERVEDDSDYTKNVQRYWKGVVRDSKLRPCPTKPFQLALGQRGKVWPTPSYHESHRKNKYRPFLLGQRI